MILIFCLKESSMILPHIIKKYLNEKCIVLKKFNKYFFDLASAIIPIDIDSQKFLNKYPKYKKKMMISDEHIYDILDDKTKFYNFVKKNNILNDSNIKLINSFDKNYNGPNIIKKFILKQRDGYGSSFNKFKKGKIYDIIKKYSSKYQIQEIINIKKISGINGFSNNGKLIHCLDFYMPNFTNKSYYLKDNDEILKNTNLEYKKIISKIIKNIGYSGFFEFEFVVDDKGSHYLMECNPRLTGNIKTFCFNNENKIYSPIVKYFIIPYCDIIKGKQPKIVNFNKKLKTKFYGTIPNPIFTSCKCGCGQIYFF